MGWWDVSHAQSRVCVKLWKATGYAAVITQSHPGPKARWTLYVHTQETVRHTLLRVAVCNKTVVSDSVCM